MLVWEGPFGCLTAVPSPLETAKELKNFRIMRVSYSIRSSNKKCFLIYKNQKCETLPLYCC